MVRDVVTLGEEFVAQTLLNADIPLVGDEIYPVRAPLDTPSPYITHDLGYAEISGPIGNLGPSMYVLRWEITTWHDGDSRQVMVPVWEGIFIALLTETGGGLPFSRYTSVEDGSLWSVASSYAGPVPLSPLDPQTEGRWQRIAHGIYLWIQPE